MKLVRGSYDRPKQNPRLQLTYFETGSNFYDFLIIRTVSVSYLCM